MTKVATHRVFNHKRYQRVDTATTKQEANRLAKKRREQGLLVRIVPLHSDYTKERYGIYIAGH